MRCNVCGNEKLDLVYESASSYSITSLCQLVDGKTRVFFCSSCTHLQTPEIVESEKFYSQDYKILMNSENEDQLYKKENGTAIYRLDYQSKTLLNLIDLPQEAKVLDYGCAAAGTSFRLLEKRRDIKLYLYDVSEMYIPFWSKYLTDKNWSTFSIPMTWKIGYFDLITSYFSLEHIAELEKSMSLISSMLIEGGYFYAIVPNWQKNIGDFVVIDHANHFSEYSIRYLLKKHNFTIELISDSIHENAFVIVARKRNPASLLNHKRDETKPNLKETIRSVSDYWKKFSDRIQQHEVALLSKAEKAAIYGAGFYGTYIASSLTDINNISCFVDQSPFRQGNKLLSKKIVSPKELPANVSALYLGLNPNTAESIRNEIKGLFSHSVHLISLN